MNRVLTILLILCILFSCASCAQDKDAHSSFFYLRTTETIRYGASDALVCPVTIPQTSSDSLAELLELYLNGPTAENFHSPIPAGTTLLGLSTEDKLLTLELSPEFSTLDGIRLSLAGACLSATCKSLAGYESIRVHSGGMVYTFQLQDFIFSDPISQK